MDTEYWATKTMKNLSFTPNRDSGRAAAFTAEPAGSAIKADIGVEPAIWIALALPVSF